MQYLNVSRNTISGIITNGIIKPVFDVTSNEGPYVLDLSFNRLEGTVPNFDVKMLDINVVGNIFDHIDPMACGHEQWNDGSTLQFQCDGIACPLELPMRKVVKRRKINHVSRVLQHLTTVPL